MRLIPLEARALLRTLVSAVLPVCNARRVPEISVQEEALKSEAVDGDEASIHKHF
jgi:hypothetical protein